MLRRSDYCHISANNTLGHVVINLENSFRELVCWQDWRIQGGLVVINHASHLRDPSSTLASGHMWAEIQSISTGLQGFFSLLKIDSQSITSGWVCGAPRSHMDRMAAAMGAFTCIRSDPIEPVDPEKPL